MTRLTDDQIADLEAKRPAFVALAAQPTLDLLDTVDALRAERDAAVNALGEGMDRAAVHYGDAIRAAVARAERAEQRIAHVEQQLEAGPPSAFSGVKRQGYNWCAEAIRRALSGEEGPQ